MQHSDDRSALIGEQAELDRATRAIELADRIGVDTEADSRHHYPEKVCLVQVAADGSAYLIDPLARLDLTALGRVLADPAVEKILHGADFDLRGFNRDWGFTVRGLYDTNLAAKMAGLERLGLAALIEDLLGLTIPKDLRLRRADWSRRPLTAEALGYAVEDVVYLGAVRDAIDAKLAALGRREWATEEFSRIEETRYEPPGPQRRVPRRQGLAHPGRQGPCGPKGAVRSPGGGSAQGGPSSGVRDLRRGDGIPGGAPGH